MSVRAWTDIPEYGACMKGSQSAMVKIWIRACKTHPLNISFPAKAPPNHPFQFWVLLSRVECRSCCETKSEVCKPRFAELCRGRGKVEGIIYELRSGMSVDRVEQEPCTGQYDTCSRKNTVKNTRSSEVKSQRNRRTTNSMQAHSPEMRCLNSFHMHMPPPCTLRLLCILPVQQQHVRPSP